MIPFRALEKAVRRRDVEECKRLLEEAAAAEEGGDRRLVNAPADPKGKTLLMWCVLEGLQPIVELLLQHGADLEAGDSMGRRALHYAVKRNRHAAIVVQLLLDAGASLDARTQSGYSPLMFACWHGSSECVRILLAYGKGQLDLDAAAYDGATAWTLVGRCRRQFKKKLAFDLETGERRLGSIRRMLQEAGATPPAAGGGKGRRHALLDADAAAASASHQQRVSRHQEAKKAKLIKNVFYHVQHGNVPGLEKLLSDNTPQPPPPPPPPQQQQQQAGDGEDDDGSRRRLNHTRRLVNVQKENGLAPIMLAARNGRDAMVTRLLSLGAGIEAADASGYRAVHHAAKCDRPSTLRVLLYAGARADARTEAGVTPLMAAALHSSADCVRVLLNHRGGAQTLEAKATDGRTALHMGVGNGAVLALLLAAGADLTATDNEGRSPLDVARELGRRRAIEMLEAALVDPAAQRASLQRREDKQQHRERERQQVRWHRQKRLEQQWQRRDAPVLPPSSTVAAWEQEWAQKRGGKAEEGSGGSGSDSGAGSGGGDSDRLFCLSTFDCDKYFDGEW